MKCMEKEWDSYSVVIEDIWMFPLSCSFGSSDVMIVDVTSEKFNVVETWIRYCHPGKWHEVMDHFVAGTKLNTYENCGRMRIEKLSSYVYLVTMEKRIKNVERACAKCTHHFEGWDFGPCRMCRRLQSEEYDLVCGGKQFVGSLLKCEEERGIKRGLWERLWIGSNICGKDGRYWVEK